MFIESVFSGLKVLTYWETYVAVLEYFAIFLIPMAIAGMIMERSESGAVGCISMLLTPLLEIAATVVFIFTLAPIIFGMSADAAWSAPWQIISSAPLFFLKLIGILVVATVVLAFIPIIGQITSLSTFVLGAISLMFVLGIIQASDPNISFDHVDPIPDLWFIVGLIVIGGVVSWIATMIVALIATTLDIEGAAQLIMVPIGGVFGFIPVFMYGAWLGAQIVGSQ